MEDYRNNSNGVDRFVKKVEGMIPSNVQYSSEELEALLEVLKEEIIWKLDIDLPGNKEYLNEMLQHLMAAMPDELSDFEQEGEYDREDAYGRKQQEHMMALKTIKGTIQKQSPQIYDMVFDEKKDYQDRSEALYGYLKPLQNLLIEVNRKELIVSDMSPKKEVKETKVPVGGKNIKMNRAMQNIISRIAAGGKLPDLAKEIANADEVTRNYNTKEER